MQIFKKILKKKKKRITSWVQHSVEKVTTIHISLLFMAILIRFKEAEKEENWESNSIVICETKQSYYCDFGKSPNIPETLNFLIAKCIG